MNVTASNPVSTAAVGGRTRRRLESVAGSWPIGVKIAASVVLIGGPVAQLIDRSLYDMSDGFVSLFHAYSTNPGVVNVGAVAGMLAPALLIGMVLIWFRLARVRSRIAASISLISGVIAFTCLAVSSGYSYSAMGLSEAHLGTRAVADALSAYAGPPATFLFTTFDITSVVCILAAAWGLWRSRAVSRVSIILLALFIGADMALPLPFDPHYIGLAATVLMSVSLFTAAPLHDGNTATSIEQ
jgi:hypothetical protein